MSTKFKTNSLRFKVHPLDLYIIPTKKKTNYKVKYSFLIFTILLEKL